MHTTYSGQQAISIAVQLGLPLHTYGNATEAARDDLSVEEARQIMQDDPSRIWIEVSVLCVNPNDDVLLECSEGVVQVNVPGAWQLY